MKRNPNTQKIFAAFGNGGDRESTSFNQGWGFEQQLYSFPELLGDWMAHEGCANDTAAFLTKIGLAEAIKAEELRDVYTDVAIPSPRMSTLLSAALPGQALRPDAPPLPAIGMYGFRGAAERWRKQHKDLPMADIDDEIFDHFSTKVIQGIRKAVLRRGTPPIAAPEEGEEAESALSALQQRMMEAINALADTRNAMLKKTKEAPGAGDEASETEPMVEPEEIYEALVGAYHKNDLETLAELDRLFQAQGIEAIDDDIRDFLALLEQQTGASLSQALRFLRQSHGWSQLKLATTLGVSETGVSYWETRNVSLEWIGDIATHLAPGTEAAEQFILLAFPALDDAWLEAQEEEYRAGMYLRALRQRAGIRKEDLAKKLGVDCASISRYETGARTIPAERLDDFIAHIPMSEKEAARLTELANYTQTQRDFFNTHSNGQLLALFMEEAELSFVELAEKVGVATSTLEEWVYEQQPITPTRLHRLIPALEMSLDSATRFVRKVRPSIISGEVNTAWLRSHIRNKHWEILSWPALDDVWLNTKSEDKRLGLYLRALRQKAGVTQPALAAALGFEGENGYKTIKSWEKGYTTPDAAHLGKLTATLHPSDTEMVRLATLMHPTILENVGSEWLQQKRTAKQWEMISYPALDPDWLEKQDVYKQGSLLLDAHRNQRGLIYSSHRRQDRDPQRNDQRHDDRPLCD